MHGAFGEDGHIQALLESIGMPYSGSGVAASAMAMDKDVANRLYAAHGLRVPRYAIVNKYGSLKGETVSFKVLYVVKPINGGSSAGTSIVKKKSELAVALRKAFAHDDRAMLQEYICGRELTCGVLEGRDGKAFALPPTEIIPRASTFFDYKAKYSVGGSTEITPAPLPKAKIEGLQKMALAAHELLGCRGMSRSDFILRGSTFYILETNTIPGMTQTSLLPQAAKAAGIEFAGLLDLIIYRGVHS